MGEEKIFSPAMQATADEIDRRATQFAYSKTPHDFTVDPLKLICDLCGQGLTDQLHKLLHKDASR